MWFAFFFSFIKFEIKSLTGIYIWNSICVPSNQRNWRRGKKHQILKYNFFLVSCVRSKSQSYITHTFYSSSFVSTEHAVIKHQQSFKCVFHCVCSNKSYKRNEKKNTQNQSKFINNNSFACEWGRQHRKKYEMEIK